MQILHSEQEYRGAKSVLALGTFDGVHIGHAALIRRARELADMHAADLVVCTFDRHPLSVLNPALAPAKLTTPGEKFNRLALLGADYALIKPFTKQLAAMPAREYIQALVNGMRARAIVVGENHHFGLGGEGDASLIRALSETYGFIAEIVPPVYDAGEMVSSTLIRALSASGQDARARRLLDVKPIARENTR